MKIVKFLGGLGNQMFQYAFYKSLTKVYADVKADTFDFSYYSLHNKYELNKVFNIEVPTSSYLENIVLSGQNYDTFSRLIKKLFRRVPKSYYCQINSTYFDANVYVDSKSRYLDGYWQNYKYFLEVNPEILIDFSFPKFDDVPNLNLLDQIYSDTSISVHVRRGDYVGNELLGNNCDLEYYKRAICYFNEKYLNPRYFVFSNDLEWCRQFLDFKNEVVFVDNNTGIHSYRDMQLMSNCTHNIVANSSFSWWGAWLNQNPAKEVLAPSRWFNVEHNIKDIVPAEWTII